MHPSELWQPPENWLRITSVDAHTAGEPLRVITSGFPELIGKTILEKRNYARKHYDHIRTALMWEPRGHADMYGCILTEPVTPDGTYGILFLHNEGFSTMCGHGIIGVTKVLFDTGMHQHTESDPMLRLDTPAGRVTAVPHFHAGIVTEVSFLNVPSFVYCLDQSLEVDGVGTISYDIAFGGAFYAFVQAEHVGLSLTPDNFRDLIEVGMSIKRAVMACARITHPFEEDLSFLYGTIFVSEPQDPNHHSRNVCIFADGEVDRCPTGTGLSARAAIHHARGELNLNQPFTVESLLGTCFTGEITEITELPGIDAVIPKITGSAYITGRNEWFFDPSDPLQNGFLLR
jgi:trans-L-3-hydroxyproline dehydratase